MAEILTTHVLLPIGLGLIGFIEPCSIGSAFIFLKYMEGKPAPVKALQVSAFTLTRAFFIGVLGALAALAGSVFVGFQKAVWVGLGAIYVLLGILLFANRAGAILKPIGFGLSCMGEVQGSAALGLLFGLNIPACAAPLLVALLGVAAAGGVSSGTLAQGFLTLGLFGLALSAPLVAAVLFPYTRVVLDRLVALSHRMPRWTGLVMIALGLWSIWFGLSVTITSTA
jgi:cytochrome c-type biogenesis protein